MNPSVKLQTPLRLLAICLALSYTMPSQAAYDIEMMRALGLPVEIADYFSSGAKFPAGKHNLDITINGQSYGQHEVNIDSNGNWLYDASLADTLGLYPCTLKETDTALVSQCYPGSRVDNETGNNQLVLLMPQSHIRRQPGEYEFGGNALMLNYTASSFNSQGQNSNYAALETGFNSHNWLFRHNGTYSKYERGQNYTPYNSYLQRTFTDYDATLRLGRATLSDSLYSGITLDGLQWLPDSALSASQRSDVPPVEGIAESQAKIEIFQNGRLVYATLVQPGAFRLTDIPVQFDAVDLTVTQTESNGSRKEFVVPYLTTPGSQYSAQSSYSLALGQIRNSSENAEAPFITGSFSWPWRNHHQLRGGSFLSRDYYGAAAGYNISGRDYRITTLSHVAHTRQDGTGGKLQVSGALPLAKALTLNAGYSIQSEAYRTPTQSQTSRWTSNAEREEDKWFTPRSRPQRQSYSLGLGWNQEWVGNLSLGMTSIDYYNAPTSQRLYGYWSRQFGKATLGVSLEKERNSRSHNNDTRLYATLSLPLGNNLHYSANVMNNGKNRSIGNSLSGQALDGDLSYGLNAAKSSQGNSGTYSGNLGYLSPFTTLSGSYSQMADNQRAFYYNASGSLVGDSSGFTLSPQQVGDTFGVLTVPGLPGVKVSTPGGTVKTYGKEGKAVIPRLRQYQSSLIKIDTSTLPAGTDIDNGVRNMNLARGSVKHVRINAVNTLRVIARIRYADGNSPTLGSIVRDDKQRVVTFTDGQGSALIERQQTRNADGKTLPPRFSMETPAGQICYFELAPSDAPSNRAGISQRNIVCR